MTTQHQSADRPALSRRGFLAGAGAAAGAFTFGFSFPLPGPAMAQAATGEVNAWVVIRPDESVVIRMARAEMGQGALTGLAQLVAEELDCDWDKVGFELVAPGENRRRDRVWRDLSTGGSRSIRGSQDYLRAAGATARAMLVRAAAQGWGARPEDCTVAKGVISHAASGRSTTFGAVADAASRIAPPTGVKLKDPKDWTIAGQPLKRIDTRDKLDGSLVYGMDFTMPGMLVAVPKACPVHGGKLKGFEIELVQAYCAQMRAQCTLVQQDFDGLIPALQSGKVDAIFAMETGADALMGMRARAALAFPAEAVEHHREAARRGQEGEIAHLTDRILKGGGDHLEVGFILGGKAQVFRHCFRLLSTLPFRARYRRRRR